MGVDRIIEIYTDNRHLSVSRGFMMVMEQGQEIGRVPLDNISAVIANAHGLTYSNNLLVSLAQNGIPFILCAANHSPVAFLWAVDGHHIESARIESQINATQPMAKQLWKQVICSKIAGQAAVLGMIGQKDAPLLMMIDKVRSGDPDNIEGQAARRYWGLLFGEEFRRNRNAADENALLNYGYTIVRSTVARSIMASGLHPALGIHHRNSYNAMRLVDDIIEPYRPYVDITVWKMAGNGLIDINPETKKILAALVELPIPMGDGVYPMRRAILKTTQSLARIYEDGKIGKLDLPIASDMSLFLEKGGAIHDNSTQRT